MQSQMNVSLWFPWNFLLQQLAESDTYDGYWDKLAFLLVCEFPEYRLYLIQTSFFL